MSVVKDLIRAFATSTGNKVYLRNLEELLEERLSDLTPQETETLYYLIRDIEETGHKAQNGRNTKPWMRW